MHICISRAEQSWVFAWAASLWFGLDLVSVLARLTGRNWQKIATEELLKLCALHNITVAIESKKVVMSGQIACRGH